MIVVDLQNTLFVGVMKCTLKVFCHLFLSELSLHSVDDSHDALDVSVKDVTFLQTLERDLACMFASPLINRENIETVAFVGDVIHDRR